MKDKATQSLFTCHHFAIANIRYSFKSEYCITDRQMEDILFNIKCQSNHGFQSRMTENGLASIFRKNTTQITAF